ncbi:MAG: LysM peptidoglycan-binding domain-containing protein [Notoacmeibacter sp.]
MASPIRAFSILSLGAAVAGGLAWTSGELQRFGLVSPFAPVVALLDPAPVAAKTELSELTKAADAPANPAIDQTVLAPTRTPAFDIVRVQPDGSMVIAGRAAAGAAIDIIAADRVIGQTSTDESGSFAFVLEQPLAPGDYEIGLNAKVNGEVLTSEQTAIVQIPKAPSGDVLAIVTAPNSAPEVMVAGAVNAPSDQIAATQSAIVETPVPMQEPAPNAVVSANPVVPLVDAAQNDLKIEAVEIDGNKTFIAGTAAPGSSVRLYLGETVIGEAKANEGGRFLVESNQPISVATHTLRADSLNAKGEVIARASVPFERVDGEKLAMVAAEPNAAPAGATSATQIDVATPELAPLAAPSLTKADTSVIIRKGDTLWQIARRVYGKGVTFSTIYNANLSQISNPNRIWPGQVFAVPRNTEAGDAADFGGIEGQKKIDVILQ